MQSPEKTVITVEVTVNIPVEKAWEIWTNPEQIKQWSFASEDWHTPTAENDLRVGGKFSSRMEAKDGSFGFDFWGIYDEVEPETLIAYTLGDQRKVRIIFAADGSKTHITQSFEAEDQNPIEMQKGGWQAIMNNFKKYAESI
ncbi:SRPBCC family protein [Dyadobacter psychrotolerans]|uniref:Polyketide cyclase n=1 Tax=Dyadobacter psychrotolerans TaxID=2541721 RepID=A0A4R5DLB6_9BACT|nr:SRPBCC family protein [Dyadobacter psychrotolerans]TDE12830.1 polyketide cyclase [Dyadobacter psychrotolerans]